MGDRLHVPKRGCSTCPYRRDTPPGIWSADEYEKLRLFDLEPHEDINSLATFHCHQQSATGVDTVCRGWLGVHRESVAVRLALANGLLVLDDVPLEAEPCHYATGNEAADAGLAAIEDPSSAARLAVRRLIERGVGKWEDEEE